MQVETFQAFGASKSETEELCRYDEKVYDAAAAASIELPLDDEPCVAFWRRWAEESRGEDALTVLSRYLPQLRFPIEAGISKSRSYRLATLSGVEVEELSEASGLAVEHPEAVELEIYRSFAGHVPLLICRRRAEFVTLVQALARRNEPVTVPESQGASMVSGLANWPRIRAHRRAWEERPDGEGPAATWAEAFAELKKDPEQYLDRFIILSDGPYSAVRASDLGLEDERWREISLIVRREHECTHYLTRRVFGSMRNHLLDELIADYTGLVTATGAFRASWFLRFLGLEDFPYCRAGGRIEIYRGKPPLSDGAFRVLQAVVKAAAEHLEAFDREQQPDRGTASRGRMILALASTSLSELAAEGWAERVQRAIQALGGVSSKEA